MDQLIQSSISTATLVFVFIVIAGKHLAADYVLQSSWMALGKERASGWFLPLAAHSGCHGLLSTGIALALAPRLWWLGIVDFLVHFAIDRCKGHVVATYHWGPDDRWFWWSIGFDQTLHHLTGLFLAIVIVSAR